MPSAAETGGELRPVDRRGGLPAWCDQYLAPAGTGRFFSGRSWIETVVAHAVPDGWEPVLAVCGGGTLLLPLFRRGRALRSMTTPYTQIWEPLPSIAGGAERSRGAARGFARLLRLRPAALLEAVDGHSPVIRDMRAGLRQAGILVRDFAHFGSWHEAQPAGQSWDSYLRTRPAALRTTISRKLARSQRDLRFELVRSPGPRLDAAIQGYEAVYARSWKAAEPYPLFNAALMRAAAATGELRLGVLWAGDGEAAAAQYWVVSGGTAWLLKLAHDEQRRAASPGTALTAAMVRHLLDEEHVTELDFGRGDDAYKRMWVGRREQRIGMLLVDPRHPAGLAALLRHDAARLVRAARGAVAAPRDSSGP